MGLKETVNHMKKMMAEMNLDLMKASEKGNKTAAQRVRTSTIKFAKLAKLYRKESVAEIRKSDKRKPAAKKSIRRKAKRAYR